MLSRRTRRSFAPVVASLCAFVAAALSAGCASTDGAPTLSDVGASVRARSPEAALRLDSTSRTPPDVDIADGLTQEEAVAIALWNSPSFQATLVDLGMARADLAEAGLLRNPIFSLLFPVGPKQLEFAFQYPFDVFVQRPARVAAAKLNVQAVGQRLVWDALALTTQVPVANGGLVPLSSVAHVEVTPTPNEITRENGSRRIDVTSNVRGRDLGAVARDIQAQIAGVTFPAGYYAEVLGEYAERQASSTRLRLLGVTAVAAIFLILMADFGSARVATLVFLTLPFALVGAIVATFLTGAVLSLGSLVGLVTVIGISARNGIMLVSHYRHLELAEVVPFGRELMVRGAEERLAPILMTALATGLALVPIVLGGSRAGYEIEHPLAVVILGGLTTSTLLNLFIVPALYLKFGRSAVSPTEP